MKYAISALALTLLIAAPAAAERPSTFRAQESQALKGDFPLGNGSWECHCLCANETYTSSAELPGKCKEDEEGEGCVGYDPIHDDTKFEGELGWCESVFVQDKPGD